MAFDGVLFLEFVLLFFEAMSTSSTHTSCSNIFDKSLLAVLLSHQIFWVIAFFKESCIKSYLADWVHF